MPAMRTALAALALLGTASAFVAPTSNNLKLRTSANAPLYSTIDKKTEDVSLSSGGGMFTTSKPEDRRIGQVERAPASERPPARPRPPRRRAPPRKKRSAEPQPTTGTSAPRTARRPAARRSRSSTSSSSRSTRAP